MAKIIGILVVFSSVLGGFALAGGKIMALIHPFELIIIGGAALGAFIQSNRGHNSWRIIKKSLRMFSSRYNRAYYLEVLRLVYDILTKSRREGMMAIEGDIEEPHESPIFAKYPSVLNDERMVAYICDYLRIMTSGNMAAHELENLFEMELASLKEELHHPGHSVGKVADALPGFGIVAAVLGIVMTMALLGEAEQARIGESVAAALVGTFLGILAAYGFIGPLAVCLEQDAREELNVYEAIKASLIASASGLPPTLAVEFGRKVLLPGHRPSFQELEQAMRGS